MNNNVKELRQRFSLTQEYLASQLQVSRQTIISIENGRYNPSLELAFKMSSIFKLPIEKIFIYEVNENDR